MALKETTKKMHQLLEELAGNLTKAERGVKAASQRVRTGTIELAKLSKLYRKESIAVEHYGSKPKAKKKTPHKKVKTPQKPKTPRRKKRH